ncbi:receptor-transporting protein 3-like [Anomaloglossus baeobatrachus]|uniref:receptor-transporting protein 3-like n=1 Tax=Anomaloglossus baeobatrachus TaxID=238106 RepID=UPI003F502D6E
MENSKWQNLFDNELQNQRIPYKWSVCVDDHLQWQQGYLQYTQHTFARFQCLYCGRRWNSAQVHILFLIRWDATFWCGTVNMKIFRQSCRLCNGSTFQNPTISKENSKRVIINLVIKIQRKIYGWKNTRQPLEPLVYSDHREGPHEKKYCEACKMKVCPWYEGHRAKTIVDTLIPIPETFHPQATTKGGKQNEENLWATDTTTAHTSQDNGCFIFVLIVLLIFGLILLFFPRKQFLGNM